MRPNADQKHETDCRMAHEPFRQGYPPRHQMPYTWSSPDFCYSFRCVDCRNEVPHSEAVHHLHCFGIAVKP